jgi:hypothetical protein
MDEQIKQPETNDLKALRDLIIKVDPNNNIYKETSALIDEYLNIKEDDEQTKKALK